MTTSVEQIVNQAALGFQASQILRGKSASPIASLEVAAGVKQWPDEFTNSDSGKPYTPHHDAERNFVYEDGPRYALAKGGEGGGKSVAGVIKDLNRLRRGCNGIMVSPDFEHFKRSLWPEFRRWCPKSAVVEKEHYRLNKEWEPTKPFEMHFHNEVGGISTLLCGGIEDPTGWEGPNVNFAHFDEARRHKTPAALKVLDGRVRIPGPNDEPPQMYFTTTPAKHWLYDYFGDEQEDDQYAEFKKNARVVTLLTTDNERAGNLSEGFTANRGMSLTEAEKRVLLLAEWEDIDDATRFLSSILLWDNCKSTLPTLTRHIPLIGAVDAGVSSDCFAFVAVGSHPEDEKQAVVFYARAWEPKGKALDFDEIESEIKDFCSKWNVEKLVYDPYQLHQMMSGLHNNRVVNTEPFNQGADRLTADKHLLDVIMTRRVIHDGNPLLRRHLDNADRKSDLDKTKLRIVKRQENLKIDLAVSLSMAVHRRLAPRFKFASV